MKQHLSHRQLEVLNTLKSFIETNGWPPARMELAEALGLASPNAAQLLLEALAKKGHITISPKTSRGIRIAA